MIFRILIGIFLILCAADFGFCANYLLYLEAQGIGGYSSHEDKGILYSKTAEDVMQKPSVGFDYLQRFSGETRDVAAAAIQFRLAYDDFENRAELQLYNAYFKYKSEFADFWIGHNRPALGLSSYFDSHGLLLDTLAMNRFGFDRDWGVGIYRDYEWGNIGLSVTTGSGMPVYFKGNYLFSGRVSFGTLNQDNYNIGFSVFSGETLDTMGYHLMDDDPRSFTGAGMDFTYLWNNFESRFEAISGKNMDENSHALFWRGGVNLLDEGRLKLEVQPMYLKIGSEENYQISAGPTFMLTGDLTIRAMYAFDHENDEHRAVIQVYYYRKL